MSEEGQIVESEMSAEELAKLSPDREIEGSLPDVKGKKFANVSLEAATAACAEADKQADEREAVEGVDSGS